MQAFPLLCLTRVRTVAVVALTRPPCHRLRRSPKSSKPCLRVRPLTRTSRARDASKDAEVPSKRPGSPLGLLSCGCLENGVAIHMGIMRSRYERSFLRIPSRRFVCLALLIGGYFGRNIGAVSRFGAVSDGSFAAAHNLHGLDNSKEWSKHPLGKRRPRPDESTVG
jgi:hypothetical protein